MIPASITTLFWDSDPMLLDLEKHKKTIITRTLNYGTLSDWNWLRKKYGSADISSTISRKTRTNIREGARKLAEIYFS